MSCSIRADVEAFLFNGTKPDDFGCAGYSSVEPTLLCLDEAYERYLGVIKSRLYPNAISSASYTSFSFSASVSLLDHSIEYLRGPLEGEVKLQTDYVSALIYTVCMQEFPSPPPLQPPTPASPPSRKKHHRPKLPFMEQDKAWASLK